MISDQIISNFIMCLASTLLPSLGGSKFDSSALIDANVESMRGLAPARHMMSFDIREFLAKRNLLTLPLIKVQQ